MDWREKLLVWRMDKMCDNCPFAKKGPGAELRKSLGRKRMNEIRKSLEHSCFTCHKTSSETGNGTDLICAGALQYQEERNLRPQYKQIMERLCLLQESRKKRGKMTCGFCGSEKLRLLERPSKRHSHYTYCHDCQSYFASTNSVKVLNAMALGWMRTTTPPKWVVEEVKAGESNP